MANELMVEKGKNSAKKPRQGIAVAALLLNIMLLPGLGSLLAGKTAEGVVQMSLSILSAILFGIGLVVAFLSFRFGILSPGIGIALIVLGLLLGLAVWAWAFRTGLQLVKAADA